MSLLDQIVYGYVPRRMRVPRFMMQPKMVRKRVLRLILLMLMKELRTVCKWFLRVMKKPRIVLYQRGSSGRTSCSYYPIVLTLPYNAVASNFNSESKVTCPCLETGTVDGSIDNDLQANCSNLPLPIGSVTACTDELVPQASSFVMPPETAIALKIKCTLYHL